jgi:16S rRNA (cytosine1402-N4)-methyltransferase
MNAFVHETVMREETVAALAPRAGRVYADATLGGGGHAEAILEASSPDGRLIGIDRDEIALDAARARLARFGARATLVHGEMADVREILSGAGAPRVDGLVADLGTSSPQLDDSARGFSFSSEGPLDMRMDRSRGETARELLARLSEREIADVVYQYGEEKKSRRVARSIVRAREEGKLETTADLARAVRAALGPKRGRIDPATRTFQAIRIAVNGELDQLTALIDALPDVLEDSGVAAIISFHSLEDRIVKHAFRDSEVLEPLFKKPRIASDEEQAKNPRARSAKLRAARRVARAAWEEQA